MKKRILFFLHNGVGGAERMTINIAKLLPSDEYEVIICKVNVPYIIQNGRIDDFIPRGFKLTNIFWYTQLGFLRQIYTTLKRYKPNIVFSSFMAYNQRLLLFKPLFKDIRFIIRNDNYLFTINKIKGMLMRFSYRNADSIIAQTLEMKRELNDLGIDSDKIEVLQNFIDEEIITEKSSITSPYPNDSMIRFVAVGRLAYQKGFDVLIKAFKIINTKQPNSELYIIGSIDGESKAVYSNLIGLVETLNLEDKVIFTGYTDNPYKYIKNASVFVLSSRYEGLPNVLIESQFLNVPAAATTCIPIISRIITNGVNGFLADNENPESLAQAMLSASKLQNIKPTYQSAKKEDFINLFK
ncbi:MAG: glycosyltransferase [Clostridia bacterium]|nr:glycosyltransferase [Clostridia bacterium]